MSSFSLTPAVEVFPCPHCGETINTTMQQCNFCGAFIDRDAARESAAATARISAAVNDASYLRIMIGVAGVFFLLRFAVVVAWLGLFGFLFFEIAVPILLMRWWVRYGRIRTTDADFRPARKVVIAITVGVGLFFLARLTGILTIRPF